ncbi:MAG: hypothetical protein M3143_05835 [Actinomycetota bacterium]|nr:hypothetical protein [Actinomycetota bacterium]
MNIAQLFTAAPRRAPADRRVGTVLAVPGRGDVVGLLTELADRLALDGCEVVVLLANPQDGAIRLVEEAPQHWAGGSGRRRHRCGDGADDARRGTTPCSTIGTGGGWSVRWSSAACLLTGLFHSPQRPDPSFA